MDLKELQHEINMEIVKFEREWGKNPNTLLLGESEGKVFKNADRFSEFDYNADRIWGMYVSVSGDVDTLIKVSRDESIVEDKPEDISEHVIRISIYVLAGFVECFKSFINIQIKDSSGVRVSSWSSKVSSFHNDKMFNIRIGGLDKDVVNTFGNDVSNLWSIYVYIINDMFKGDVTWFEEMKNSKKN
jgi:hypothetical protein